MTQITAKYVSWPEPEFMAGRYNILSKQDLPMLVAWVDCINVLWWYAYYCARYGCGQYRIVNTERYFKYYSPELKKPGRKLNKNSISGGKRFPRTPSMPDFKLTDAEDT